MKAVPKWALALGVAGACGAAAAGTMAIDPVSDMVNVGDSFDLRVHGTGFVETIVGGGFDLAFDSAVLQLVSVTIDPSWEFAPKSGVIDNVAGTLTDASFATFANPRSGSFDAALVRFTATAMGNSNVALAPSAFFVYADEIGNEVTPTFAGGAVQVVDEASTLATMLGGLALLTAVLRRQRRPTA